jgi:hypothetical protein
MQHSISRSILYESRIRAKREYGGKCIEVNFKTTGTCLNLDQISPEWSHLIPNAEIYHRHELPELGTHLTKRYSTLSLSP